MVYSPLLHFINQSAAKLSICYCLNLKKLQLSQIRVGIHKFARKCKKRKGPEGGRKAKLCFSEPDRRFRRGGVAQLVRAQDS